MPRWSARYAVVKKRIAPLVFLVALTVLATRTCASEMATVEITFDLGQARPDVRLFRVDAFRHGSETGVLHFERHYSNQGPPSSPTIEARLDPGLYELLFSVTLKSGLQRFERVIDVTDRAEITLRLERNLNPSSAPRK
ncbi:MAG: hypothetical protein MJE77_08245 [Proteobacteria bacterium]|nr:hypothetical protein [Pseudomonadota bacterium]